jgi:sugar phosphate isomerase/epimerase
VNIYKTLWGAVGAGAPFADFRSAIPRIAESGWDGVSVALIAFQFDPGIGTLADLGGLCSQYGLGLSVMVHTFGDDVSGHLGHLGRELEHAASVEPHHIICHGGVDAWSLDQAMEFYSGALEYEKAVGVAVAHETHRSRLLHSPWQTTEILGAFPNLRIALDLSHWVVMCERLIHDQEAAIALAASRAIHIDARVGHEQGPQVPDPRDPLWASHRDAFESWWDLAITSTQVVVPEYGPPPYLPTIPHTGEPVADLWAICNWAKDRLRTRYT